MHQPVSVQQIMFSGSPFNSSAYSRTKDCLEPNETLPLGGRKFAYSRTN